MEFKKLELSIFLYIYRNDGINIRDLYILSNKQKKSKSQIYRILKSLIKKKLIFKSTKYKQYKVYESEFSLKLGLLLSKNKYFIDLFSNDGLDILYYFLKKRSINSIISITGYKKDKIYNTVKFALGFSVLWPDNNKYIINSKAWSDLRSMLLSYSDFYSLQDSRVPVGSKIYYKNQKEIIFSYDKFLDYATPTAFTAFRDYDILILNFEIFYYIPNKKLNKKEILFHTLKIVEKTKEFRHILYLALFYYKYKNEFRNFSHEILDNLDKIFKGEKIERYPPLNEIKEKAELYGIRM